MKKTIYLLMLISFILSSCEPLAEIYDELEANDTGYSNSIAYTLTADDYEAIGDLASNPDHGDFIADNMYFTDDISAATNVPEFLGEKFPALSEGSSAMVTYNYSGDMPEDYVMYTGADEYELAAGDYESIDGVIDVAKYYSPTYAPEVYLPSVLTDNISDPSYGDLVVVEYEYSDVDPQVDFNIIPDIIIWDEQFSGDLGNFSTHSIVGAKEWYSSGYGGDEYAKMSGYDEGAQDNEDWLVSPAIDLTGTADIYLRVRQALNYMGGEWDNHKVYISTDFDGADVTSATWNEVTIPTWPSGSDWTYVESGDINIDTYIVQTIFVAFKFLSNTTTAATWEVDWVEIITPGSDPLIVGKEPVTYEAFYEFGGNVWAPAEGVYLVTGPDYDAMGAPGNYDNFSDSDLPSDYIPALLENKFPLAGPESEVIVVYNYYTGISGLWTIQIASTYTFMDGEWDSDYEFISDMTSQFLFSNGKWVFDPTVIFTMNAADFQLIVDYVDANIGSSYLDTYGTFESYYGAGSYYQNFDLRSGNFDDTVFDTWEDAVQAAVGDALLPGKFPAAVAQVSGIDVFYIVHFATYSGVDGSYNIKFQCTKAGPNPEFTYVEGPTAN